jgi:hypothetical protein
MIILKTRNVIFAVIVTLAAFMGTQSVSAGNGGGDVAMEMILLQAEEQQIDYDGDGHPDTFSANYTVHKDGTASGGLYVNYNFQVSFQSGSIKVGPNDEIIVTAFGRDSQGEEHTVVYQFEPSANNPEAGHYGIMLFDTTSSMNTHAFEVSVQLSIR